MTDTTTRADRLTEAVDEYLPGGDAYGDSPDPATAKRYLLVESNMRGSEPPHYLTTHDSPQEAWDYRVDQEYPSDWALQALIDLDTGETYDESDFLVTVTVTKRGDNPKLSERMRESMAPLIAFRDQHLDVDYFENDDERRDAALALDNAFDHIDSALATLEDAEEEEAG